VGLVYVLLSWTPIPHVASAIEGFWYLSQEGEFDRNFNLNLETVNFSPVLNRPPVDSTHVSAIADALRQLPTPGWVDFRV